MPAYTPNQIAVARAIWFFWKSKGYDDLGRAAWVANTDGETSFDPHVWGDNHQAIDIVQHHKVRRNLIKEHTGIDMETAGVVEQCEGVYAEITQHWSAYRNVDHLVRDAPTLRTKIAVIVQREEQSGSQARDIDRRTKLAEYWLEYGNQNWNVAPSPASLKVVATPEATKIAAPTAAASIVKHPVGS